MKYSGTQGQAVIIFGGKIGVSVYQADIGEPNMILKFAELKTAEKMGQSFEDTDIVDENRATYLVFNKLESIDIMQRALDIAKKSLEKQLGINNESNG